MKYRKIASGFLALVLMTTACIPSMAGTTNKEQIKIDGFNSEIEDSIFSVAADPRVVGLEASSVIRIVVEFDELSVIDYAIQKGVQLDQLEEATAKTVETKIENVMNNVKNDMIENDIKAEVINEFTEVFSGFSTETTVENAKAIEKLANVKRVYISTKYFLPEPQMKTSTQVINATSAWDLGYKGEGQLIAVIDSCFATDHQDMQKISEPELAKYKTAESLPSGLPGTWRNIKMPYAYNYYNKNQDLSSDSSNHGAHVAGIVGANGDVENGGVQGVAPETQLLGMRVFGEASNTYSDIYVKAIEDALKLGADGINMSLGSTAGFLRAESDDPARVAIRKAAESGVVVAISAGNVDRFGNGYGDPLASNPDTGLVGSPSLNPYSLSVASVQNSQREIPAAIISADGSVYKMAYKLAEKSPDPIVVTSGHAIEVVSVGTGEPQFYDGKDVKGKFVMVVRTGNYYYAKIKEIAQANEALGVIVRGHYAHGDYVNMNIGATETTIPMMSVSILNGNKYESLLKEGKLVTVRFTGDKDKVADSYTRRMSNFTSWGTTPNLDFKPEITAPGGAINSTLQNGEYGIKDGTSMAAPHVAGAVGVLSQRIKAEFPSVTGIERYLLAKNLLMSTAKPLRVYGERTYTSPRRQGAGVMDLYGATSGHVVVVDPATKESKVLLKEIGDEVKFTVEVKNYAQKNITYQLEASIGTDYALNGKLAERLPTDINNTKIRCEKDGQVISEITVTTDSAISFDVSFNLKEATDPQSGRLLKEIYTNGNFVEGFVRLTSKDEEEPSIGLPYLGFYGDWSAAPVLDTSPSRQTFYDLPNGLCTYVGDGYGSDAYSFYRKTNEGNDLNAYFSPNNDGVSDDVRALYTFLRNAKTFNINILDKDKKNILELTKNEIIRKNYFDGDEYNPKYYAKSQWVWDGTVNDAVVAQGQYYYQIQAKPDGENTEYQTVELPIVLDVTNPVIDDLQYDAKLGIVKVHATDGIKFKDYSLFNGAVEIAKNTDGVFNLEELKVDSPYVLSVVATDEALNKTTKPVVMGADFNAVKNDKVPPVFISVSSPKTLEKYNESEVTFEGTINEAVGLKNLIINGVDVSFAYDPIKLLYTFNTKIKLADGVHEITLAAVDYAENKTECSKVICIDTEAPQIEVKQAVQTTVENNVTSTILYVKYTDNYTGLNIFVNGNPEKTIAVDTSVVKQPKEVTYEMAKRVNLLEGRNTFVLKATDLAKNEKEVICTIVRKSAAPASNPVGAIVTPVSSVVSFGGSSAPSSIAGSTLPIALPNLIPAVLMKPTNGLGGLDQPVITVNETDVKIENGIAVLQIKTEQVTALIEQLKKSKDGNVINLDFTSVKDANVQVNFPIGSLKDLKQNQLTVKFEGAIVEIPVDLTKISAVDEKLVISMAKVAIDSTATKLNNKTIAAYTFDVKSSNSALTGKIYAKIDLTALKANKDKIVLASVDANGKMVILGNKVKDNMISGNIDPNQQVVILERNISFKDTTNHWATQYVEAMAAKDVVAMSSNNLFNPEKNVTRAEFTTLLIKTLGLEVTLGQSSFKDIKSTEWYVAYVETAKTQGLISGATDLFKPNDKITRAEMAVMLSKALKLSVDSPESVTPSHSDVPDWAKTAVDAVKKDGIMTGDGKSFRGNDKTTRAEAIAVIYKIFNK